MNVERALAAIGFVLACVASAWACVDLSPVAYVAPPDAGQPDTSTAADARVADALDTVCQDCLSKPPCADSWAACQANTDCAAFAACMTRSFCWSANLGDLAHLQPCLITCAMKANVLSQDSPAAALLSAVFACAQSPTECQPVCVPGADQ